MKLRWNLCRDIQVADRQIDHVCKGSKILKTTGSVFHHADDPVDAFTDRICQLGINECQDVFEMVSQRFHKLPHRCKTVFKGSGAPALQEASGSAGIGVFPQVFELVLQHPGSPYAAIAFAQGVEEAALGVCACR